jgi:hypothetical protein
VKLKLTNCANCARTGNHAGLLLEALGAIRTAGKTAGAPLVGTRGQGGRESRPKGHPYNPSTLMFIVICGHRRRIDVVFSREILLRLHSIVVYNEPP